MENKKIGSIERVGDEGFILTSSTEDPEFTGGKKIIKDFDSLLQFMARYFDIYKGNGSFFGASAEKEEAKNDG